MSLPAASFEPMRLRMAAVTSAATDVVCIDLERPDGATLPEWQPGTHLDIVLPSGRVRQYSLCGDPQVRSRYRIAIRRQAEGRGGSVELHDIASVGAELEVRGLRNHFNFSDSEKYLFVAGGIGITPILPMILDAERRTRPWVLIYAGRTMGSMAFASTVSGREGGRTRLIPSDLKGRVDLEPIVAALAPDVTAYACGPTTMLDDLERAATRHGRLGQLRMERFAAPPSAAGDAPATPFEVELRRSGMILQVPANRTLGDVLKQARAGVSFSCEEGCCGLCETRVLAGTPLHRDCILSSDERDKGDRMMVCVGRSLTPRLVLDL